MKIKKISFKCKDDVEMQSSWWYKCNHDCTEWLLKNSATKNVLGDASACYKGKTAKGTIWL